MLTLLARLLKVLNSDDSPSQLALAICLAAFIGITPLHAPLAIVLLIVVCMVRVNLSLFLMSWGLFTLIAYLIDPISHAIGLYLLNVPSLNTLWQSAYDNDFWRLLGFNNTVILGSTVLSLLLSLPLFFGSRLLIGQYRSHILSWVMQTRLATWLKGGKLISLYQRLND